MVSDQQLLEILQTGLSGLGLSLQADQQERLIVYLRLLEKWNGAYNLSGIKDIRQMVAYHLLDSLAIVPFIDGRTMLDVGTGAGLPGIVLAICYPEKRFLLMDSNGKKTRFLFQVKTQLGLENVEIFYGRVETFQCPEQIDIVLCRAFAALDRFVANTSHILENRGRLLAMKGQYPEAEIQALPEGFTVTDSVELKVPGVEGPRFLIEISKVQGNITGINQ